jgi:hypothetical protein
VFNAFSLSASVIGGYGNHVYAVGTTGSGANYGEPVSELASLIHFSREGKAVTSKLVNLTALSEPYVFVRSISTAWANGGFVAVGDASDGGLQRHAVMWQGLAGATVNGQRLQRFLPAHTSWRLTHAVGINRFGYIVGIGSIHGRNAAYELMPPTSE